MSDVVSSAAEEEPQRLWQSWKTDHANIRRTIPRPSLRGPLTGSPLEPRGFMTTSGLPLVVRGVKGATNGSPAANCGVRMFGLCGCAISGRYAPFALRIQMSRRTIGESSNCVGRAKGGPTLVLFGAARPPALLVTCCCQVGVIVGSECEGCVAMGLRSA